MSGFRALTETLILALAIGAGNAFFGASDPGWLELNPTPYLLVPVLVGMRYGFMPGLSSGLVTAVLVAAIAVVFADQTVAGVLRTVPFTLLSMPAFGVVAGEVRRALAARSDTLYERLASLESEAAQQRADLGLAREAQAQLQEKLALHGARFSSIDVELQRRFEDDAVPVLPGTLASLAALCQVESAAFYRGSEGGAFELECAHGDVDLLAGELRGADAAMADAAIDSGELVTVRDLLDGGKPAGDLLAVLPWPGDERIVLGIGDMPLEALNWANLAKVETVCQWIAATEQSRHCPVVDAVVLRERVDLAIETAAQGVPSMIVLFTAAAGVAGQIDQEALQEAVLPKLASADVAATVGREVPHLAVLLPMGGVREAMRLVEAAGTDLKGRPFAIHPGAEGEEIWRALTDVS